MFSMKTGVIPSIEFAKDTYLFAEEESKKMVLILASRF